MLGNSHANGLGDSYSNGIESGTTRIIPTVWPLVVMLPRNLRAV